MIDSSYLTDSPHAHSAVLVSLNRELMFWFSSSLQDDPFAQSSSALTAMIVNQGNANHPAEDQRGHSSSSKTGTNPSSNNNWLSAAMARTMLS